MAIEKHIILKSHLSELNTLATAVESFAEQSNLDIKKQPWSIPNRKQRPSYLECNVLVTMLAGCSRDMSVTV